MIKLQNLTPSVYYNQSRDFQYIGRLYDIVLNSVKTNADMIYTVPDCSQSGSKLIDLLSLTLGFQPKHKYSVKQLAAACSVFPLLLRKKGTIQSVYILGNALLYSEGITDTFYCNLQTDDLNCSIELFVPETLSDINLLRDLLPYILPAGMTVSLIRASYLEQQTTTVLATQHTIAKAPTAGLNSSVIYTNCEIDKTDLSLSGTMSNNVVLTGGTENGETKEEN